MTYKDGAVFQNVGTEIAQTISTKFKNQAERKFWVRKRGHFRRKEDVW
jgi:hypothetical protein